jgi:hypothetical protein
MSNEVGKTVFRTSRGEPISGGVRVAPTADTADAFDLSDIFGEAPAEDIADVVTRVFGEAVVEEITVDRADQLEQLRAHLTRPITARRSEGLPPDPLKTLTCFEGDDNE